MQADIPAVPKDLNFLLQQSDERRIKLTERLRSENTDAWRVFHGSVEGRPGLTVDRYGTYLLAMVFYGRLMPAELEALREYAAARQLLLIVWERSAKNKSQLIYKDSAAAGSRLLAQGRGWTLEALCHEEGQVFAVAPSSHGKDPYLYLDFRAGRRWLRRNVAAEKRVLNLFAYTCTAGVAAAHKGAAVTNVDFSRWCLEIGQHNGRLNSVPASRFQIWQEDVFPVIRQLAQLGVKGRSARRRYLRVGPQKFDVIILDPPTVANSPFGRVDLQCDYASMLKPCLLSLAEGGSILATNHHAKVSWEEWHRVLERTAVKIGLPVPHIERLYPEDDFPTSDGEQPLKMAVITFGGL
ncbi:MAG: class I SAM-dependent methyltransferase [bacterium]|nr:class I SAM-dependent methyltransferase [bacterium]